MKDRLSGLLRGLGILFIIMYLVIFYGEWVRAQGFDLSPRAMTYVYELFPEATPPLKAELKSHITVPSGGFEIFNYVVRDKKGEEVGIVSRIKSIYLSGPASRVDFLVRYKNGKIAGIKSLVPPDAEEGLSFLPIYTFFEGRDPASIAPALVVIAQGLSAGVKLSKAPSSVPRPPKGKMLDLTNKILTPGAILPDFQAYTISGEIFKTRKYANRKIIFLFTDPSCSECLKMIKSLKKGLNLFDPMKTVTVVYVVEASKGESADYASMLNLSGIIIPDRYGQLTKLFQIPFKPYALFFANGKLKYNAVWEGEAKFLGILYTFVKGNPYAGR